MMRTLCFKVIFVLAIAFLSIVICAQNSEKASRMSPNQEESVKACSDGDIDKAKELIAKGANINAKGSDGRTPLMWASWNGYKEICELLISRGANVDAKDDLYGEPPLMWTAYYGHKEVCELLISKGADVNARNAHFLGETALMMAARNGHKEVCELLISKSADVNARSD